MADITMCAQNECPNAPTCYRKQATPSDWQSFAVFPFTIEAGKARCDFYIQVTDTHSREAAL